MTPGADDAASTTRDAHEHSRTPGHAEAGRRSGRRRMAEEWCEGRTEGSETGACKGSEGSALGAQPQHPVRRPGAHYVLSVPGWMTQRTQSSELLRSPAALLVRPGGMRGTRAYIMYILCNILCL